MTNQGLFQPCTEYSRLFVRPWFTLPRPSLYHFGHEVEVVIKLARHCPGVGVVQVSGLSAKGHVHSSFAITPCVAIWIIVLYLTSAHVACFEKLVLLKETLRFLSTPAGALARSCSATNLL